MNDQNSTPLTEDEFYEKSFSRLIGVITKEEQEILRNSTIAVAGCGGGGGISAERIVRLGIGHVKIADPELFEESNTNRQFACTAKSVGRKKAEAVGEALQEINPYLKVDVFPEGITESNLSEFMEGVNMLVEEVEAYYFRIRALLYVEARKRGIYAVRGDTFVFCHPVWVFAPDGMTFEEFFGLPPLEEISADKNYIGPEFMKKIFLDEIRKSGISDELIFKIAAKEVPLPTLSYGCSMIASLVANEVLRVLLKKENLLVAPKCKNFDLLNNNLIIRDFSE